MVRTNRVTTASAPSSTTTQTETATMPVTTTPTRRANRRASPSSCGIRASPFIANERSACLSDADAKRL